LVSERARDPVIGAEHVHASTRCADDLRVALHGRVHPDWLARFTPESIALGVESLDADETLGHGDPEPTDDDSGPAVVHELRFRGRHGERRRDRDAEGAPIGLVPHALRAQLRVTPRHHERRALGLGPVRDRRD
jgi:hypothetical protein